MDIQLRLSDALIVVDMQNDFMPGGALSVPRGDEVVPIVNRLLPCFATRVFTRDWHPANHISFSAQPAYQDKSWPSHCVQNTRGAAFHPDLKIGASDRIVSKATQPEQEAYSAFQDTDLAAWLLQRGIQRIFVAGVATEYCVKATALDARQAGFNTWLIHDAVRAVALPEPAMQDMIQAGVQPILSTQLRCA